MSKLVQQVKFDNTGIKISPIIVGCMSYGSKQWAEWVQDDKEKVFEILKHCYDRGLRTFDTADVYSNGISERLLGEFLKKFNIKRETVVILTKTFFPVDESLSLALGEMSFSESDTLDLTNQRGLSRKHILQSVKNSVERLGTYIDVLQIHRFDPTTPIKETMKALNDVVESGDVRYIGASSMLPTQFVEMQSVADKHDWFQFVNVQSCYNLLYREDERDLMQYCEKHNIALTPWSPNHQGLLTRPIGVESERSTTDKIINGWNMKDLKPSEIEIINRVEELSKKKNVSMAVISTAWVLSKGCAPIVGMSSISRVDEVITALDVKFTEEETKQLEEPYKPRNFLF
ncbi:hypothetical protein NCAS_0F04070 [Naumovozyma castellii]|uniref:NADP-dependent oxidoreductase domain-containing protein n=1 Tax=Naumovozyma castellii TaxID=27288 RepID=G0VHB8_NAUCA|nr:hypothetical protein NCAS_0F04070 [Naumovozyma castellii CBS 4309]CCC70891.1 hypothetical protein NCAS_0F04070 [Naumovozyma castellii CBS 4309]